MAYINGVKYIYDVLLVSSNRYTLYCKSKLRRFLTTIFCLMMAKATRFMWLLFAAAAIAQAKPLNSSIDESVNEIDHDNANLQKNILFESKKQQRNSALPTNEASRKITTQTEATNSAVDTTFDTTAQSFEDKISTKPSPFSWLLAPLTQKFQFSPQSFLQDRLVLLKEALNNLGLNIVQNETAKQLNGPGSHLVHFLSPGDSGFYTNRLEPAGFLGGNGWFANKGGILGGPGAIVSTGSLLTDYPSAYRRK
ncbi:uncharacterized protein LOC105835771 [Monomorium pharaonis]|uniref:uncharacterized protein LOC105835771 n=1 Tax=Monomorium pharaonis TaxID=307658 RepID=UPI0017471B1D|nr:uncharacterized protein LOC105835771 [Monomorium pharaonis]XP_036142012.1 uncharacterized protein LOC105835771 [Monomorium pharaonis]